MLKFFLLGITMLLHSYNDKLTGKWQSVSPTGAVTLVHFKSDQSFEGFVNNKPFVTGSYWLKGNIFTLKDNGCSGVSGTYRMTFFHNDDSVRIELIADSCEPRGKGMNNRVYGRLTQ